MEKHLPQNIEAECGVLGSIIIDPEAIVQVAEARIGIVHEPGPLEGREARLAARFPGCDAVVYGHTHLPQADRHRDVWILNPGSPTERRRAPARSMLELVVAAGEIRPELVVLGT